MIRSRGNEPARSRDLALFDAVPEPVWLVSLRDLRIAEVNRAAIERFGYSREEFLQFHLADLHSEEDTRRFLSAVQRRDTRSSELRGWRTRTATGVNLDTDLSVRFLELDGEEYAIVCALDMTARKTLEERLRQAGKMEALGMLAGGIAHDFNNLLTIISGYSQLMITAVPPEERSAVEQVLKASERAAQLTGQLLAFSRGQEWQPKPLILNQLIETISTMLRRLIGEHIELRLRLAPDLGAIYADAGQVDQVIMNLVVNARDAMAQGGKLVIETANVSFTEKDEKRLDVRRGTYVMIAVSDTGAGMSPETRAQVFDPFFTTKERGRGTGLGLSTVWRIVKQAAGALELESEVGRGTTVKVYFPLCTPAEAVKPVAGENTSETEGGRESILVIEDEEAVRRLVVATLKRRGYRVLVAENGKEALEIAERQNHIDVILTDLIMPGMSGVQVASKLREKFPSAKILFMSGYTDQPTRAASGLAEATEVLQKPFTPTALSARIRELLDRIGKDGKRFASGS